jgi:hypothetical protein
VFIYTREAHPGEKVLHHDSPARKLASARLLRDETGIRRPILVDDLAGTVHRGYGSMPNMTWVIDRRGRVAYRAAWTSAGNVEAFLVRFLAGGAGRPRGTQAAVYETEQLEFRRVDRARFMERLVRNGPRAVAEFREAERLWGRNG